MLLILIIIINISNRVRYNFNNNLKISIYYIKNLFFIIEIFLEIYLKGKYNKRIC